MRNNSSTGPPPGTKGISLFFWAIRNPPANPETSYTNKTVLVTGSNTGLGFEAAVKYAALGASRVILAVRTPSKGEAAKAEIVRRTGVKPETLTVMQVDMSTFESVKGFVKELNESVDTLDVVLLNAGVANPSYQKSRDGWEMTLQVNVLSTALMALLLLPKLRDTAIKTGQPPHLGIVGSGAHEGVKAAALYTRPEQRILDKVNSPTYWNVTNQYGVSKLLLMYVVLGIAELTADPGSKTTTSTLTDDKTPTNPLIIVNTCCPGACQSDITRQFAWPIRTAITVGSKALARTSEQGSRTLVSLTALGPDTHAGFWKHDTLTPMGDMVTSSEGEKARAKAWAEVLAVLNEAAPEEVSSVLEEFGGVETES